MDEVDTTAEENLLDRCRSYQQIRSKPAATPPLCYRPALPWLHGWGRIVAELDVKPDLWFFPCHFKGDPVMPGCLGLDALWQLLGFFLGWLGAPGKGRALSVGEVKFSGMVLPTMKKLEYVVELKRVIRRKFTLGTGDGWLKADGETIYTAKDLRVGLFQEGTAAPAGV